MTYPHHNYQSQALRIELLGGLLHVQRKDQMTSTIRPNPIHMKDDEGKPIVEIALNRRGTQHPIMDAADYDALPAGMSRTFFLNDDGKGRAYVKVSCSNASGGLVMASRAITGADRGIEVRHRNGNRRDLRRTNLELVPNRNVKRNHLAEIPVTTLDRLAQEIGTDTLD